MTDHQALIDRVLEIHNTRSWDRLGEVFTDDYVEEYPQSGEVFRGLVSARAVRAHYPGMDQMAEDIDPSTVSLAAAEERWILTPMFTAERVEGTGQVGTAVLRLAYPDGHRWWCVILYELRDGKLAVGRTFFAPEFPPPDWRAPFRQP